MLTQSELDYRKWMDDPDFPSLDPRQIQYARVFVDNLTNGTLPNPLYRHQYEAVMRVIYHGEKLGKWDSLLDIVTGGGKTVIMATLIAYFRQVRGYTKFLILVPWTIVRERVKDDFEPSNPWFAYNSFPLFFPPFSHISRNLVCRVLRDRSDAASIKDSDVIVANIHQLYDGKNSEALDLLTADNITPDLVVFNDEAHNAAAMQYREVLKSLRRKMVARIDLTATPYHLDKQELDTPLIYEYHIQEAMKESVVKQIVVTKPDIKSVKLQYEEWDDENHIVRTLDADEMPWEQIEAELKNSGAVKFVTAKNARRQQLQIAQANLEYQRKCVPLDHENNRQWEPLMLVVALSQKDAWQVYETLQKPPFNYKVEELLLVHSKQDDLQNKKAFLLGRKWSEWLKWDDAKLWQETRKVRVIIAVSMLREWWDVRNISVICLFRKFSYQKKWDQIHTVYWPQIIGRWLRRIRQSNERDLLFVIDHPAFSHGWLWKLLSATEYAKPLNPWDMMNEGDIPDIAKEDITQKVDTTNEEWDEKWELDIESLIAWVPDIPQVIAIPDWREHFRNFSFKNRIASAWQQIDNVKSQSLGSDRTAHIIPDELINTQELNKKETYTKNFDRNEAIRVVLSDLTEEPHRILMSTYRSETWEDLKIVTEVIFWILETHFQISRFEDISSADDIKLQELLFCMPQIFDELKDPSVIISLFENYDPK